MTNILNTFFFVVMFFLVGNQNPPGTVFLSDNIYIDQSEISNFDWIGYIIWLRQEYGENSKEVKNGFPDNEIWKKLYNDDFKINLYKNEFLNFPIVGISYQQASEYCKWRTQVVNEKFKYENKITYRLPSEKEFSLAVASEKLDIQKYYNKKYDLYKSPNKTKGKYILFLSKNVSEMTNIEGKAFGANFSDKSNLLKEYTKPEKWLGFRCIAEIKE